MDTDLSRALLAEAAQANGVDAKNSRLIRNGSHSMWTLRDDIVARVGERGTEKVAEREILLSDWLNNSGVRAVRALHSFTQPTVIKGHPITWWELLPKHRQATPAELGEVLRMFHRVPLPPHISLPQFSPLADIPERLTRMPPLPELDVAWLAARVNELEQRYTDSTTSANPGLIHGDAWQGNVAVLDDGACIVLDLEAVSVGPQSWDLVAMAVDYTDFSRISREEYDLFVTAYGLDVINLDSFRLLADIQEVRWASFVVAKADQDPEAAVEAARRLSCLKGEVPKPWEWRAF